MAYEDNREWKTYNDSLIRRGEFYFSLDFADNWKQELEKMNRGKKGRPFEYPESFIRFSAVFYDAFGLPYRQLEGCMKKLSMFFPDMHASRYTTLWDRIKCMAIGLPKSRGKVTVAVDSTGIRVTNRGEWLRNKWKVRRGWIKVHIAVDVKTKSIVSISVTDEKVSDSSVALPLLEGIDIEDALMDGAYDTEEIFTELSGRMKGPPGIKIRKNASAKGLSPRAYAVREFQRLGYEGWRQKHGYGMRWSSEGFFSCEKRMFGESVRATGTEGMFREVMRKFMLCDRLMGM